MVLRSIPKPTSSIDLFSPHDCFLRLPFFALAVMLGTSSFSVATFAERLEEKLLLLTISAATWCTQFWRRLATLLTLDWAFLNRLEAKIFFFLFGATFRLLSLDAFLISGFTP